MKVIGYFVDTDGDKTVANDVFVVIDYVNNEKVELYCPVGQHHEGHIDYVNQCERITLEEYKQASKNLYTPSDYLEGSFKNE